ncbi:MAG: sensor histidine kinase, partial [Geminicoccaceae bacterium]
PDENVAFESVCMDDVVKAALDNLTEIIAKREALVSHEPLPIVFGHAPQLIQLVQHLIDNSIRFCDQDIPRVTVSVREDNTGALLFEVGDNGIGIRESHLTYVFEPFKRLWSQDTYEGTGLGLAICKRIVEGHGGKIWCESEEGKGSRFLFMLDNVPT